jgi:hypothetical protein
MEKSHMRTPALPILALAGFFGGMVEIAWVAAYRATAGLSSLQVAREIAATVFPSAVNLWSAAAVLGIAVHLVLSVGLAIAFGLLVWRPVARNLGWVAGSLVGIGALCALWAINFLIVLPVLNPAFVTLMPYAVTLLSKALFGATMVLTLQIARRSAESRSANYAGWLLVGICRASRLRQQPQRP